MNTTTSDERLLVHLASYNTNVQPDHALPNDLADWLQAVQHTARPADIIAIGFQELLPLHLACALPRAIMVFQSLIARPLAHMYSHWLGGPCA
jgi:hypothetical protein